MSYVNERFYLNDNTQDYLRSLVPPFGYNGFGEFIFYRTYSRVKPDGGQESWADCMIRVVNGTLAIRKDWYVKNKIKWDEAFWQVFATGFAQSIYKMEWLPPGRGLWAMGSDFVYERGSMALQNCGYTDFTSENLADDAAWMMDALMCGVGCGFGPIRDDALVVFQPEKVFDHMIPDSREGWAESVRLLIDAYLKPCGYKPRFHYDLLRPEGTPIKGFGGLASGPIPLMDLHQAIEVEFAKYQTRPEYDSVYLKTNLGNLIGCCVVAGNVRRSAEIAIGDLSDPTFKDLKNYKKYPEREAWGWMSNNSVALETDHDFESLGEIAERVIANGEPGFINRRNMPFARIGRKQQGLRRDKARNFNPCGEQPLEHRELCTLAETLPTVCKGTWHWRQACKYATFYASTVTLLPTHQPSTNAVMARNRRIGVGIIDYTGWKHRDGVHKVIKQLREGYDQVRETNAFLNDEAGVPHAIRVTTVKPGGTTPKLPGKTSGAGHPTFDYTLRRVRVAKNSPIHPLLVAAGVPFEEDYFDKYTDVFAWPILQGPAKPAEEVTLWEQAFNLITLQREWSDNAVSNTLYFKPKWRLIEVVDQKIEQNLAVYIGEVTACLAIHNPLEHTYIVPERYKIVFQRDADGYVTEIKVFEYDPHHEEADIEPVLSAIAPLTKSVSLLPHSPKGAYRQMPEEGISEEEYHERLAEIGTIDWSQLSGSDGVDEKFCTGPLCEIPQ